MSEELFVVYRAAHSQQAHLLKNELEQLGIPAFITNELLTPQSVGEFSSAWNSAPRVSVQAEHLEAAQRFVAEFDRRMADGNARAATDSAAAATTAEGGPVDGLEDLWLEWPACPDCQTRRQTVCPICQTAGTHFSLADYIPAAQVHKIGVGESSEPSYDDSTVLLMCDTCDEAFSPRFYARCHRCGHDFGDGLRFASSSASSSMEPALGRRALALLFGIVAVLAGLFFLFAWILR